jgi:hypothetical protein
MTGMDTFPEDDKHWFMHLGYLAQTWAALEHSLDGIARQLHADYDAKKLEQLPISFNRKRDYIRRVFANHPNLVQFSETMNGLLDTATRHSEIRNWALHSGMVDSGDFATFNRWRKAELKHERRELSPQELYDAAVGCASLTLTLGLVARYFFGLQTREEVQKLLSEITGKLGTPFPGDEPPV